VDEESFFRAIRERAAAGLERTWDGLPVSREPPFGAAIVVADAATRRYLLLHRARHGSDYEGDFAWASAGGARFPGEKIDACARRELEEETGLRPPLERLLIGTADWYVYLAHWHGEAIALSEEHDRSEWVSADEAEQRCRPSFLGAQIRVVDQLLAGE